MRLSYHPEAEAELAEAARFHERKLPGLGSRFRAEVDASAAKILKIPTQWRIVGNHIRRFLMRRFPCSSLYRAEGDVVRVLAVKHHRRHPDYGTHRRQE